MKKTTSSSIVKVALLLSFFTFSCNRPSNNVQSRNVDILVYGGTSAGVIAAYTAAMKGKTVLLIEPGTRLGGLTTGGLGYTDIGNKYAVKGLAQDYYRRIGLHYGKFEQWIFEPHVAENLFKEYIQRGGVEVLYNHRIVSATKADFRLKDIIVENAVSPSVGSHVTVSAKIFIDCSYEGDLMAKAGISYIVGREGNEQYNETYNGVQLRDKHQFPEGVDPYKIPGKPESGLLWGISNAALLPQGSGDKMVQTYNFRLCLSSNPDNRIAITKPENYDSLRYELLLRFLKKKPAKDLNGFLKVDLMPNQKTDINNNGPFSTDMIGMNYDYPEAGYARRKEIIKDHEDYIKGLLYFIGHDPRMPQHLRDQMLQWGYPKDEYTDNKNWSPQPYIREARRMIGAYVMSQSNCEGKEVVPDGIGMAAYTMDSHNTQRIVVNGMVKNEGDVQIGGFPPYPIAYRSLIPKAAECENVFVPVCLSATHIAYGSIRMEPVFMVMAQVSATAAVLAIDKDTSIQDVDVKTLQQSLKDDPLANGSLPEILMDNDVAEVSNGSSWATVKARGSYGSSLLLDSLGTGENRRVVFRPQIPATHGYDAYVYFPRVERGAETIHVYVFDGTKETDILLKPNAVKIEGQTSGEWIHLGAFDFPAGKKGFVAINSEKGKGIVVADAVLFVPKSK